MPLVKIEVFKGKNAEYKKAILDGVHSALVQALKIPDDDRMQRLYELDRENFEVTPTKTEQCTLIEITAFKGRSLEAKRKLYSYLINSQYPFIP